MKILLVEDNHLIIKGLKYSLEAANYEVITASNYSDALKLLDEAIDLAVLDINLPDGNGYDIAKIIKEDYQLPYLFLSAKDDEEAIVKGLELGAEDYITKPFGVKELLARINRILKNKQAKKIIINGNIKVDLDKAKVYVGEHLINLSSTEYKIILLLFTNLNRIITRETMTHIIWDSNDNYVNDNTLTVNIKRIREKLGNNIIKTVKGIGYMVEKSEN